MNIALVLAGFPFAFAFWLGLGVAICVDVATSRRVFVNREDDQHGDLGEGYQE